MTDAERRRTRQETWMKAAEKEIAIPRAAVRSGLIGDRGGVNFKARDRLKPCGNVHWIRDRLDGAL